MQFHHSNVHCVQKEPIISSLEYSDKDFNGQCLDTLSHNNVTGKLKLLRISLFDLVNASFKKREKYREYLKAVLELEIAIFNETNRCIENELYNQKLFLNKIELEFEAKITLFLETIACYLYHDYGDEAKEHLEEVFESFGPPLSLLNLDLIFAKVDKS